MKTNIWILLLCLMTFIVFSPALNNGFVNWDDPNFLLNNSLVRSVSPENILRIFTTNVSNLYIPGTVLSFALEHRFFGFNPFVFHLDNVFLHIGVVVLFFLFLRRLGVSDSAAFLASSIYAVHPLKVESVAWVTARKDLLFGLFYIGALLCYSFYAQTKHKKYFWVTLILSVISVLCKPAAFTLPLVFVCYDLFLRRRLKEALWEKLYFFICLAPVVMLTYAWHMRPYAISWGHGLLVWVWCFIFYLKKFFFPQPMVLLYELPQPVSWGNPQYVSAFILFVFFLIVILRLRNNRQILLGLGLYFFNIFFLLRFDYKVDFNIVADRYLYLPSLGLCLLLGYGVDWFLRRFRNRKIIRGFGWGLCFGLIVFFSWMSYQQTKIWQGGVTLWENQILYSPAAARPLVFYKLAEAQEQSREFAQAVVAYQKGRKRHPLILRVISLYKKSIQSKPDFIHAYDRLRNIYDVLGEETQAVYWAKKAVEISGHGQ